MLQSNPRNKIIISQHLSDLNPPNKFFRNDNCNQDYCKIQNGILQYRQYFQKVVLHRQLEWIHLLVEQYPLVYQSNFQHQSLELENIEQNRWLSLSYCISLSIHLSTYRYFDCTVPLSFLHDDNKTTFLDQELNGRLCEYVYCTCNVDIAVYL